MTRRLTRRDVLTKAGIQIKEVGCGCESCSTPGSPTSVTPPSRAEMEAVAAESRRILEKGRKILASPALSSKEVREMIAEAQWALGAPPEVKVDAERHYAATKAVAWAASRWGVHPAQPKFYNRHNVPDPEMRGFFDPADAAAIWLRSDLKSWDLLEVLLHECSHHARHARGLPQDETEVALDAHHLVRRYVAEVVNAQ